jgi:ribosomal RNA assembly protein
MMEFGVKF